MHPENLPVEIIGLPGAMPVWSAEVDARSWRVCAEIAAAGEGHLVALWASDRRDLDGGFEVRCALAMTAGLLCVRLPLPADAPEFPDIADLFPAAGRMQRAAHDLVGVVARDARDARPWLRHGAWPADVHPLRRDFVARNVFTPVPDAYPFVSVAGDGVHEIPVGPVHAGIIEPGHFRFSVVGERVMRLEQHLGYTHKGIEKRFEALDLIDGAQLAGRISGDSTVAYAWAYAMALESACAAAIPARAAWLRALLLERERVANHLGDLGFLGNDAGLAFGLAQFSRLKEQWLRTNAAVFRHRYLMDTIVPGGVAHDIAIDALAEMRETMAEVEIEVLTLRGIYDEHSGLQDRFLGAGVVTPVLARRLGLTGLVGRASAVARDLRVDHPCAPWDALSVRLCAAQDGDVAARVAIRFEELLESLRLQRDILDRMPEGSILAALPEPPAGAFGAGWVEGWRGEVLVALEAGPEGRIRRCHAHDPSWQNWPLLEHAVIGNIVPDFPLINKSFNLSYSGVDL
ncbi:MAG: NADH-quinone oxidoreductase subunit C [Betaproteobacteria bacterium]